MPWPRKSRQEQAKLHRQANFDSLTGLPNRMMAFDRINLEIHRARRSRQRFAVLFIDLDNFKNVNDSLGHAVGDELLVAIGARLQAILRDADTVARLGGDEFLVLAPGCDRRSEVEKIAERLMQAVSERAELNGRKVVARCSIGIALFPDNGDSVETLMANADNAMYQAKATRQGSAIFFTEEMNIRLRERMQMEQDLNLAMELGSAGAPLPADLRHGRPAPSRRRGAVALAPPREGLHQPGGVHSRWRRPPARSSASATGFWSRPAAAGRPGTTPGSIRDSSRSTSRASSSGSAFPRGSPS